MLPALPSGGSDSRPVPRTPLVICGKYPLWSTRLSQALSINLEGPVLPVYTVGIVNQCRSAFTQ